MDDSGKAGEKKCALIVAMRLKPNRFANGEMFFSEGH
jgi:hypothetical protein